MPSFARTQRSSDWMPATNEACASWVALTSRATLAPLAAPLTTKWPLDAASVESQNWYFAGASPSASAKENSEDAARLWPCAAKRSMAVVTVGAWLTGAVTEKFFHWLQSKPSNARTHRLSCPEPDWKLV